MRRKFFYVFARQGALQGVIFWDELPSKALLRGDAPLWRTELIDHELDLSIDALLEAYCHTIALTGARPPSRIAKLPPAKPREIRSRLGEREQRFRSGDLSEAPLEFPKRKGGKR